MIDQDKRNAFVGQHTNAGGDVRNPPRGSQAAGANASLADPGAAAKWLGPFQSISEMEMFLKSHYDRVGIAAATNPTTDQRSDGWQASATALFTGTPLPPKIPPKNFMGTSLPPHDAGETNRLMDTAINRLWSHVSVFGGILRRLDEIDRRLVGGEAKDKASSDTAATGAPGASMTAIFAALNELDAMADQARARLDRLEKVI